MILFIQTYSSETRSIERIVATKKKYNCLLIGSKICIFKQYSNTEKKHEANLPVKRT